ncbi:hypothetical protein WMF28_11415 [Sorangium sp. So ce590]|uniref:hypothetical protein n=1 Tax=Sorangium sp. So ce590 TaxID=3133317 RepID=UPI003F605470
MRRRLRRRPAGPLLGARRSPSAPPRSAPPRDRRRPRRGQQATTQAGDSAAQPGFRLRRVRAGLRGDVAGLVRLAISMDLAGGDEETARIHEAWGGVTAARALDARTELAWALVKRVLARTPDEQAKNWSFPGTTPESQELCGPAALGDEPVAAEARDEPCTYRAGQVDDRFRYLERGFVPAQIASSDSHDGSKEPGFPRTYFRSATDSPAALQTPAAVEGLRGAHAIPTYGPLILATIGGKTYGEVAAASTGKSSELLFDVQTASWFGVDRVEIYLNGAMIRLLDPEMRPSALVDVRGKVTFTVPERDSWVVIIGIDGDGRYDAPLPRPDFCSRPCDPGVLDPEQCPAQQDCLLEEAVCGFPIPGKRDHRRPALGHHDD